jgi:G patch domain-containing protein 1
LPLTPLPGKTIEDFNKELADYAKAAMVFRPLGGAMAGRFTSATVQEMGPKIQVGLFTPKFASGGFEGGDGSQEQMDEEERKRKEAEEEKQKEEKQKDEDPRTYAARMGMYGPMTRDARPWQPSRLLCKRFGVKDPNPEPVVPEDKSSAPGTSTGPGNSWNAEAALADAGKSAEEVSSIMASAPVKGTAGKRDLANIGLGEDDEQGKDTLTYERPGMDIFKAIFASDEEDSDDEDKMQEEQEQEEDQDQDHAQPDAATAKSVPQQSHHRQDAMPAHLAASNSTKVSYEPKTDAAKISQAIPETVDLATFKPTFVPRSERETKKSKDGGRKEKKDKKGKGKALMSFADDEAEVGDVGSLGAPKKEKRDKSKKRDKDRDKGKDDGREKKRKRKEEDDGESMWVEKPPPDVVKALEAGVAVVAEVTEDGREMGPPQGRKRAADFM